MRTFHMISAKVMGWETEYLYFPFPTDRFSREEAEAQFKVVEGFTQKANGYYRYTAYEFCGVRYYSIEYSGIATEQELIDGGWTIEELNDL